jgi:hypothetical protein
MNKKEKFTAAIAVFLAGILVGERLSRKD